jgi:hypothetical protein
MKSNYIKKISGLFLALGLLIATPALGLAQQGYPNYNYGRPGYSYNNRSYIMSMARFKGYRQGFKQGREDRFARSRYGYWNPQVFRDYDQGWNGDSRFRGYYEQVYRDAYQIGYRDAFYGRPYRQAFSNNPGNPNRYDDRYNRYDRYNDWDYRHNR